MTKASMRVMFDIEPNPQVEPLCEAAGVPLHADPVELLAEIAALGGMDRIRALVAEDERKKNGEPL